jgi:hypothetical protein
VQWTSLARAWAANQTLSFSSVVKVEERITYLSCQVISYAGVRYLNSLIYEAESLEKEPSLFSIWERSVMENAVSSCHLPEWVEMGWVCLGGGIRAGMGCRWGGER